MTSCYSFPSALCTQLSAIPYIETGGTPKQVFDLYLPLDVGPRPLVIYVHGGGFDRGFRCNVFNTAKKRNRIAKLLHFGIAFASIDYRLVKKNGESKGISKCYNDVKACIKHIRDHASTYNIQPDNIALWGESAGAGLCMLVGFRQTEFPFINALVVEKPQATYDLTRWGPEVFDGALTLDQCFEILTEPRVQMLFGNDSLNSGTYASETELPSAPTNRHKVDILSFMGLTDPPIWVENTNDASFKLIPPVLPTEMNHLNHHLFHSKKLVDQASLKGLSECYYRIPHLDFYHTSGDGYAAFEFFLKDKLLPP